MQDYLLQATVPATSGTTADIHVNTFHIASTQDIPPGDPQVQDICDLLTIQLTTFYSQLRVANLMRGYDVDGGSVKMLRWPGVKPNYPLAESNMGPGNTATDFDVPPEVALCLSFANDSEVGIPRAQRRGRIYIGGMSQSTIGTDGRPTAGAVSALLGAGQALLANIAASFGDWAVYSSRAQSPFAIERIWVDDEFDTQRRRGRKATTRSEWKVA